MQAEGDFAESRVRYVGYKVFFESEGVDAALQCQPNPVDVRICLLRQIIAGPNCQVETSSGQKPLGQFEGDDSSVLSKGSLQASESRPPLRSRCLA